MLFVVVASSAAAAEGASESLRRHGFIARAACRGESSLVIVTCRGEDRDEVVARVRQSDEGSWPIMAGWQSPAAGVTATAS